MIHQPPTVAGFLTFIRNVMGISTSVLPDADPVIPMAFEIAVDVVNRAIQLAAPTLYNLAVYNLAGSNVLNYAQDASNAPVISGSDPPAAYFANIRRVFNMNGFVSGVIQSAGDEGTNQSMVVQEAAKNFTLSDLQNLKDPYGRRYLAIAQFYGPSIWGVS